MPDPTDELLQLSQRLLDAIAAVVVTLSAKACGHTNARAAIVIAFCTSTVKHASAIATIVMPRRTRAFRHANAIATIVVTAGAVANGTGTGGIQCVSGAALPQRFATAITPIVVTFRAGAHRHACTLPTVVIPRSADNAIGV